MMQTKKKENDFCTLYIVRHGETDWNRKKLLQGRKGVGLNSDGIAQTQKAAKFFNTLDIDAIYSSNLHRAKQTARIIYTKKNLQVKITDKLQERAYGMFEGMDLEGIQNKHFPELSHLSIPEFWPQLEEHPEVESYTQIIERIIPYIQKVAASHKKQSIILVTHAGILRALLVYLKYATYPQLLQRGVLENLANIKIESDGHKLRIMEIRGINIGK